jgi:hypothetical protein
MKNRQEDAESEAHKRSGNCDADTVRLVHLRRPAPPKDVDSDSGLGHYFPGILANADSPRGLAAYPEA